MIFKIKILYGYDDKVDINIQIQIFRYMFKDVLHIFSKQ